MRDGMTVGEYLALPGTKRRDVRVAWRKHGMITINGEVAGYSQLRKMTSNKGRNGARRAVAA
jgi:hypothetical protein